MQISLYTESLYRIACDPVFSSRSEYRKLYSCNLTSPLRSGSRYLNITSKKPSFPRWSACLPLSFSLLFVYVSLTLELQRIFTRFSLDCRNSRLLDLSKTCLNDCQIPTKFFAQCFEGKDIVCMLRYYKKILSLVIYIKWDEVCGLLRT